MENDPQLDGKYLGSISQDFAVVANTLKEASWHIRKKEFSDYPIFPVSKDDIPLGKLLIGKDELALSWNFHASFLEEFTDRKLVDSNKLDEFKDTYKDPDEFCCLFVVDKDFVNFVYIPYPTDDDQPAG